MNLTKERMVEMLEMMLKSRMVDEMLIRLISASKIPGFLHLGIGEEATFVGSCMALNPDDYIMPTHRGIAHVITKGVPLKKIFADIYGRASGTNKGRGGIIRVVDSERGVLGISGTIGGVFGIGTGAALASQYKKDGRVTLVYFGDGASNRGTFHEVLNLASVWRLPVVYLCDNNQYAISTPISKSTNIKDIATRAQSYGIPGMIMNGNDVVEVYEKTMEAVDQARNGGGPALLEAKTYRFRGHWEGDSAKYRPAEELKPWLERDPIKLFQKKLTEEGILTEDQVERMKRRLEREIDEAVAFAENSPLPEEKTALEGLYA
jgi:TPP-dependent pyruvate/acetoin dehydrogenase alpha subunit